MIIRNNENVLIHSKRKLILFKTQKNYLKIKENYFEFT